MYLLLKMVVFHCYVSLPEGKSSNVQTSTLHFRTTTLGNKQTPSPQEGKGGGGGGRRNFEAPNMIFQW